MSTALPPPSVYASSTAKEAVRSAVQPKTFPPSTSGETDNRPIFLLTSFLCMPRP